MEADTEYDGLCPCCGEFECHHEIQLEEVTIGDQRVYWTQDEYGYLNLRCKMPEGSQDHGRDVSGRAVHAFIQKRPAYCDRGHYSYMVEGHIGLDGADSFPRYMMDLDRCKAEVVAFLNWRLYKIP